MFLGITIFWTLLRPHFSTRLTAGTKITLGRAQNKFIPGEVNSIVSLRAFGTLLSDAQLYFIMIMQQQQILARATAMKKFKKIVYGVYKFLQLIYDLSKE